MKNLELKSMQMLTKGQMKMVTGGQPEFYACNGANNFTYYVMGDNCCAAQGACDAVAFSNAYTNYYPNGGNVECADNCD